MVKKEEEKIPVKEIITLGIIGALGTGAYLLYKYFTELPEGAKVLLKEIEKIVKDIKDESEVKLSDDEYKNKINEYRTKAISTYLLLKDKTNFEDPRTINVSGEELGIQAMFWKQYALNITSARVQQDYPGTIERIINEIFKTLEKYGLSKDLLIAGVIIGVIITAAIILYKAKKLLEKIFPPKPPPDCEVNKTGILGVASSPMGASIWIDGVFRGSTPLNFVLSEGLYNILLKKEGYKDYTTQQYVSICGTHDLDVIMVMIPTEGIVGVSSTPQGAEIWIDGKFTEKYTPSTFTLTQGTYNITLKKSEYVDYTTSITIIGGDQKFIYATLTPIVVENGYIKVPVSIDVVKGAYATTETPIPLTKVYVDGVYVGDTRYEEPDKYFDLTLTLKPGTYEIGLWAEKFTAKYRTYTVQANQTTTLTSEHVTLSRLIVTFYWTGGWADIAYTERTIKRNIDADHIPITEEVLSWLYTRSQAAWSYAFTSYWGKPYDYFYPPAPPAPNTYTFADGTWKLIWELKEVIIVVIFAIIAVILAIRGGMIPVGGTIQVPMQYSGMLPWLKDTFKPYSFAVA